MAIKYYLLTVIQFGSTFLWPGTLVDDATDDITGLQAAAGAGALWPSGDTTVAAAALVAQAMRGAGRPPAECAAVMTAAAAASISARVHGVVADETALAAIPAAERADEQVVLVGAKLWYRSQSSSASPSAGTVVESDDSSTGRWLVLASGTLASDLASTVAAHGTALIGDPTSGGTLQSKLDQIGGTALPTAKTQADATHYGIVKLSDAPAVASTPIALGANSPKFLEIGGTALPTSLTEADTTHYGITKLSVAPATSHTPISIGDNDPRVFVVAADMTALRALTGARYATQIAVVTADGSMWRGVAVSTLVDDGLLVAGATSTFRWLRLDKQVDLALPVTKDTADAAALYTVPAGFVLALYVPFQKVTTSWSGGTDSAIGLSSSNAGLSTKGDLCGGSGGDVAATLVSTGAYAKGTKGTKIGTPAAVIIGGETIRHDRIVDAFTAGVGVWHVPVQVLIAPTA